MDTTARFTALIGRVLLSSLFLVSGFGKLANPAGTKAYIAMGGLPLPDITYGITLLIEIGVALALLVGFRTRISATVLAVFTLLTAVVFHNHLAEQAQMVNFLKNLAITGGLMQVAAFGAGAYSLDARTRRGTLAAA